MIRGIPASKGIAIGNAYLLEENALIISREKVVNYEAEINAFYRARDDVSDAIENSISYFPPGSQEAELLNAHQMMLLDDELADRVENMIREESCTAAYAVEQVLEQYAKNFEAMEDEYFRARATDCRDLKVRLIAALAGVTVPYKQLTAPNSILVAKELLPSQLLSFSGENIDGIILEQGSVTSHVAILASGMGIPAIVGVPGATLQIQDGARLILNGEDGTIIVNPTAEEEKIWTERLAAQRARHNELLTLIEKETQTLDGKRIPLLANVGNMIDIEIALKNGAEGIGLFRTEFIYMHRETMPSEDEQYKIYRKASMAFPDKPVIIRTLDVGGDKEISYIDIPREDNPFLGYRAIRYCLDNPKFFKSQLRAILRANLLGNIKVMFPMITTVEEYRRAKSLLQEAQDELENEGIDYGKDTKVGIMIETPSAAIISDLLAKEVDFFSIGTNDLIQYIMAADRTNPMVRHLNDAFAPAVLRLIEKTIENGHKYGIPVGLCGEAGSNLDMTRLLVKYGIDEISMPPASILEVRNFILNLTAAD